MQLFWTVIDGVILIGMGGAAALIVVAGIVWLCEVTWEKPKGSMGSYKMGLAVLVMATPFLLWSMKLYLQRFF